MHSEKRLRTHLKEQELSSQFLGVAQLPLTINQWIGVDKGEKHP